MSPSIKSNRTRIKKRTGKGVAFRPRRRTNGPQTTKIRPGADPRLNTVFAGIGAPRRRPFTPDPFQLKALAAIKGSDCLVSAPTGSGKTWIAEEAIARVRKKGGKAWYASPLKALTNSKHIEFGKRFGTEAVGILTGDRKENSDAPIIVGTAEILRNQLYDAMHQGIDLDADLVVLDEAHFLGEQDRGVVWEEIMIYLPVRVRLLLLSATIHNAQQIADWLESIRARKCVVVEEKKRPVPLFPLFFHPSGRLLPLVGSKGMDRKVNAYLNTRNPPVLSPPRRLPPFGQIIRVLRRYNLLPAIFFLKSRADCDAALELCDGPSGRDKKRLQGLDNRINELTEGHPRLAGHRQVGHLRNAAVASHHSGQLPAWKLLIENLMTDGLLDSVFATSTVAAGVNFPARSILFLNSDRYNGHEFVPLSATEFHQMTGRAGRRGKDRIGFAVAVPGRFMDLRLVAELCSSKPEDVLSQIKIDFSMVLNLLLSHTPNQIEELLQRSFATYLTVANQQQGFDSRLNNAGRALMDQLPEAYCAGPGFVFELTEKRASLIREIKDLGRMLNRLEAKLSKAASLVPGRLFADRRGRTYCAIRPQIRRDEEGILACRVKWRKPRKGKHLNMRWFPPEKVSHVFDKILRLPPPENTFDLFALLSRASQAGLPPILGPLPREQIDLSSLRPLEGRFHLLQKEIDDLICNKCPHFKLCHGKPRGAFRTALDDFAHMWTAANSARMALWNGFVQHLEFLKEEGFVAQDDKLTHDGAWASRLRLDQPLMIAEGLRKGLLPESDPALLAALVAPFVYDRETDVKLDVSTVPKRLSTAFNRMKKALGPLMERKAIRGFEVRPLTLWPAATIYAWANGASWEKVLRISGMAEGDLAMLVSRTSDNLRQIASLTGPYPATARSAADAVSFIMREPVLVE